MRDVGVGRTPIVSNLIRRISRVTQHACSPASRAVRATKKERFIPIPTAADIVSGVHCLLSRDDGLGSAVNDVCEAFAVYLSREFWLIGRVVNPVRDEAAIRGVVNFAP